MRSKTINMEAVVNHSVQKANLKKEENTLNLEAERLKRDREVLLREGKESILERENTRGVNQVLKRDYIAKKDRDQKKKGEGKDPDLKRNTEEKTEEIILKVQSL
jgi:hypothetical protein